MIIGIIANEPSGDLLGAALIRELRALVPDVRLIGVAGPMMQAAGCETIFPLEKLSIMGLWEVLIHLPRLLIYKYILTNFFIKLQPDIFISIDAPDFNLSLAHKLKKAGIKTVHLVSPTVWAWRAGRVKKIRQSIDLLLSIFPFEEKFLRSKNIPVIYIGHPLADEISLNIERDAARLRLNLPFDQTIIALLPGSRMSEVRRLTEPFLATAQYCFNLQPELKFIVPLINIKIREVFTKILNENAPNLPIILIDGHGRDVLAASDIVLTASGTATLEALLLKRPMIVAYRIHPVSYFIVKQFKLIKVSSIALANLLSNNIFAPEFIQTDCRAELIAPALLNLMNDSIRIAEIQREYLRVHQNLRCQAAQKAAQAVLNILNI